MRKKSGLSTHPCGTPLVAGKVSMISPLMSSAAVAFINMFSITFINFELMPFILSFLHSVGHPRLDVFELRTIFS